MPDAETRISLGTFKSPLEAVEEGKKYFPESCRCLFCSKEDQKIEVQSILGIKANINFISSTQGKMAQWSIFLCSIN